MTGPRQRDARRPLELLGLAAGMSIAIGLIVLAATKRILAAGLWTGIAFVVIVVVVAMLALVVKPERDHPDDEGPRLH